jgi:energy-coupling factor transport system substrate-specific component
MATEVVVEKKAVTKRNILKDFTTLALVLIPIGIGINYVGGLINKLLALPLFLDSIGTIIVGIIAGPWVGAVTGLIHNIVFGLTVDPVFIPYAIINLAFGLAAGFMARAGWFSKWYKVFYAGLVIMALGVGLGVPIDVIFFGGVQQGAASAVVWSYLMAIGVGLWKSVFAVSIFREFFDKMISVFVAFFVVKALPPNFLRRFPGDFLYFLKKK